MAMNASHQACHVLNITTTNGIWHSQNPLVESLPLLITQLAIVIFFARFLFFILKPLHQPLFVTDILGGVMIGPSLLGMRPYFSRLFPLPTVMTLETVAYMALDFYIFLVGLEMDVTSIRRADKRELSVAAAGIMIPMSMGIGLFFLTGRLLNLTIDTSGCLFWGLTLTVTGFPVVARILSKLKLVHSDIGRMAMSTAIINDFCSWILVAILLPTSKSSPESALYAITATIAFILICICIVRPTLVKIFHQTSCIEKNNNCNNYSESYLCFVLIGVVLCSFVTDLCGTYSVIGAFVFGIIIPNKELRSVLIERFQDFVSGIMLPLFFAICGMRINVHAVNNWLWAGLVVILLCVCKILTTYSVCFFTDLPSRDSFALGVLMNTKGILAVVVLNIGWDKKVLHVEEYTVMVVALVIMTSIVGPTISAMYKTSTRIGKYEGRTIQRTKPNDELRILSCIHSIHNVSGMINLLTISNATKNSPLSVFALQLVELTGRASPMLIVHSSGKTSISMYGRSQNSDSNIIINAFENLETHNPVAFSVQSLTSLSPFITMHEDVCILAENKRVAFMILPFHKQAMLEDDVVLREASSDSSFHDVNMNILANAPCSVGILVDRGLKHPYRDVYRVAMIFIGGPDDREALAYAWRMSGQKLVELKVVRILSRYNVKENKKLPPEVRREIKLDNEYVQEFRLKTAGEQHVSYSEKVVDNGEEAVAELRAMDHKMFDLYVVGRQVVESPVTAGLVDWNDNCQEIGVIGDLLVSSNFVNGSVLVVQQYAGATASGDASVAWLNGSVSVHSPVHNIEPL
ncbi:hypothetical protein Dsin_019427 [Dipteronia sinensis]|uniref:Cation/H+ exchanger domain-containing protein n=1 Tax=Dipteronia sinensis TaxID=43782 RepID=A0AAE0A8N6_9ROSI|nr:hypothetical protein Dsin_019427 [Dipteronia sinensis]